MQNTYTANKAQHYAAFGALNLPQMRALELMSRFTEVQKGALKGAIIGPLAVFPAVFVFALAEAIARGNVGSFYDWLPTTLFAGLWGACIAYVATFFYGMPAWYALWRLGRLNAAHMFGLSLVPSLVLGLTTQSTMLLLMAAYFSLAVCSLAWLVSRKHVQGL